eukprot:176703-Rhodomonas_salina.1
MIALTWASHHPLIANSPDTGRTRCSNTSTTRQASRLTWAGRGTGGGAQRGCCKSSRAGLWGWRRPWREAGARTWLATSIPRATCTLFSGLWDREVTANRDTWG